jgi:E1A/CREB-binding protein
LIKKAVKEGVVVERNTLSDFFLQPTNECKANISAACLPYCENDFWPGEAERLLEKKNDKTSQKKETQVGRLLRVAKRDERKGNLEDILLVHKVILFYFIYDLLALPAFCGLWVPNILIFIVASLEKGCAP